MASLLYGKRHGIYIGDKGIVNTITSLCQKVTQNMSIILYTCKIKCSRCHC
ncbi:hypothetical protein XCR1_4420001 [Xenorhabdus cabanillasii JM26]|uniref:Uncharacterized protein n=1 Tax=Xenorhabdus cabanillasii JM26 TaxID=1427517 RepID=W1J7I3_9GAMM|nr:hypothetical protein XCR1_4420001 [Xenorhabdus cabanillasii JM26]